MRRPLPPRTSPTTGASISNRHVPAKGQLPRRLGDSFTSLSALPTNGKALRSGAFWMPTGKPCARSHSVPTLAGSKANTPPTAPATAPIVSPTPPPLGCEPSGCAFWFGCEPPSCRRPSSGFSGTAVCANTSMARSIVRTTEVPTATRPPLSTCRARSGRKGPRAATKPTRVPSPAMSSP